MARRITLALVVALVIAGTVLFVTYRKITSSNRPVVQPPIQYVAATHPVDPGQVLRKDDLTLINWPRTNPLTNSFVRVQDVVGRAAIYPLAAGQPITDQQLAPPGTGFGLAGEIPSGMRAIALHSDEVVGVAGFLMPGTHVDMLVTYHEASEAQPVTATVLQNVEVLAVGHEIQPDPSGKPANVDVVTLLLSPQDAEKAVLAAAQGNIHFVLRNGQDTASSPTPTVDVGELSGAPPVVRHDTGIVRTHRLPPPPKPWVVETLLGNKKTTDSFN